MGGRINQVARESDRRGGLVVRVVRGGCYSTKAGMRVNRVTGERVREREPGARGNPHPPAPAARSLTHRDTHTHTHSHQPASFLFPPFPLFRGAGVREKRTAAGGIWDIPPHAPRALPRETEHHRRDMSVAGSESPNCWGSDSVDRSFKIKKNENFFSVFILCTFHRARRIVEPGDPALSSHDISVCDRTYFFISDFQRTSFSITRSRDYSQCRSFYCRFVSMEPFRSESRLKSPAKFFFFQFFAVS